MNAPGRHLLLGLLLLLVLAAGVTVLAQSSASFGLTWHVIGSGGGLSTSAGYQVYGTLGQSLASPPALGSASYTASSGFWAFGPET